MNQLGVQEDFWSQNNKKIKQKIDVADKLVSLEQIWKLFYCTECVANQNNFSLP